MNRKKELRREILWFLLMLSLVVGLFSGVMIPVRAAGESFSLGAFDYDTEKIFKCCWRRKHEI